MTQETLNKIVQNFDKTTETLHFALTQESIPEALTGLFQSILYLIDEWDYLMGLHNQINQSEED